MWVETPKGKGKKPVNKDRFISYVYPSPTDLSLDHPIRESLARGCILTEQEDVLKRRFCYSRYVHDIDERYFDIRWWSVDKTD